jgi:MFS family permease
MKNDETSLGYDSTTAMSQAAAQSLPRRNKFAQTVSALRHRNYRLYWFGQLFSVLALNMEHVAQSWLVLELTNSPLALGLTGLAHALPTITLTLVGGVIADRTDRRRVMIASQSAAALIFLILTVLVATKSVMLWHVMVLAFCSGAIRAFDRPSRMALLPQMVPKEDMANAVAVGGTIWQLNRLIGPALAGMIIYLLGVAATYGFCLIASAVALCLWLGIRTGQSSVIPAEGGGLLKHMMEGLTFIRTNEIFYTFIGMTFFNSVFGMCYLILMPVFARDILQVGSQGFGFLQSVGGAGALAGTLAVAYFSNRRGKVLQALLGGIIFGSLLVVFAFSESYPLSLGLAFLLGITSQAYMTTINTTLQLNLPEQLRGRVMGIFGLTWDLMPVGGMVSGTVAEIAGAPMAVALGGIMVSGLAVAIFAFKPQLRHLD